MYPYGLANSAALLKLSGSLPPSCSTKGFCSSGNHRYLQGDPLQHTARISERGSRSVVMSCPSDCKEDCCLSLFGCWWIRVESTTISVHSHVCLVSSLANWRQCTSVQSILQRQPEISSGKAVVLEGMECNELPNMAGRSRLGLQQPLVALTKILRLACMVVHEWEGYYMGGRTWEPH